MKKVFTMLRMTTFAGTVLTSIPLFINYLRDIEPEHQLITHLHVWFGLAFVIFAIISMIMQKKEGKAGKDA
ncbi:MAG: hypothetical protein KAU44_07300 [Candidatus Marinimicrobia bacterium]|nr:hypothetical protein [Candidatus Neomarinimicrobiota bacterium]